MLNWQPCLAVVRGMSAALNGVRRMAVRLARTTRRLPLRVAGAGLLFAAAAIHLDLYLTGYRTIPTIGWLFLLQVIAAFAVGALVLATQSRLAAAAGAALALSTLGGYLLALQFGLFGFREVRTTAGIAAGIIEVAAFAVLAICAAVQDSPRRTGLGSASAPAPSSGRPEARLAGRGTGLFGRGVGLFGRGVGLGWRQACLGAGSVAAVALALLGGALADAGGPSGVPAAGSGSVRAGAGLRSTAIDGLRVLTNAQGHTLYWFSPDTPTKSACNGTCAAYWPPVPGPLTAAAGITGRLGTIKRADGSTQETYDGHPLYTYAGDSAPGQANGNNLDLNGGRWHEMLVSGG